MNGLKVELGYGGLIHHFKNYILRANGDDKRSAFFHAIRAKQYIEELKRFDLTVREELNLSTISSMVDAYETMLDDISSMHERKVSPPDIDKVMRYDDRVALTAFVSLQQVLIKKESESSQKLIKSLSDIRSITVATGYLSTLIIVSLIIFLARNYYSRILLPISNITLNMKELAGGQINEALPNPNSNDEISEMIDSIEVFRQQAQEVQEAERRFGILFDASPFGMLAVSESGDICMANTTASEILGYSQVELLELPLDELVPGTTRKTHATLRADYHDNASSRKMSGYREVFAAHKNGQAVPVEISLNKINLNGEKIILCAISDISFRKRAEHELQKLSKSVERSPNLVLITDADGHIEYVNNSFTSVTGYSLGEVLGKPPSVLSSGKTKPEVYESLWRTISSGNEWRGELLNQKKDGELFWASHLIFPITNDEDKITNFVSLFEDISESKKVSDELAFRADHDLLTGLKSRHSFEARLISVLNQSQNLGEEKLVVGSVCFIDLDQFKVINDTSGHVAGDALLKKIGSLLLEKVRKDDLVARFGGDEFVILMENCPAEKSLEIAENIRVSIERIGFSWEGVNYTTTCSIGVVQYNQGNNSLTEIMKRVDAACYVAKDSGRNRVHTAFEEDDDIVNRQNEMHWLADITAGLTENRFKLFAQKIAPVNCCGKMAENMKF